MATQTSTTGNLEYAQNTVIAKWLQTAEHNAPCVHLIDRFTLGKGEKTYRFPKVGQATFANLTEGVDMVTEQDIGLSYVDASPSEVGAKFVLTDKLVRQASDDAFKVIGEQLGNGFTRKRDGDIITLFGSLDNAFGKASASLGMIQATGCITVATALKIMPPLVVVHHPNALGNLAKGAMAITSTYFQGIIGYSEEILRNFWGIRINGVNFFHDGNIAVISGATSGYGAIFNKSAMAIVESRAPYTARERDESLRGTEIVMVADYIAVEVDGAKGASMRYEIGNIVTT